MKKDLLHTPEGVRDIATGVNVPERLYYRTVCTMSVHYMDITISRHRRLNFLMCLIKNVEVFHRQKCLSFLTGMEIHWCCARI